MADLDPIHPGEILKEEFFARGQTVDLFALDIDYDRQHLWEVVRGQRPIDRVLADKLGEHFGMSSQFWLNLQARYVEQRKGTYTERFERAAKNVDLPIAPVMGGANVTTESRGMQLGQPVVQIPLETFEELVERVVRHDG